MQDYRKPAFVVPQDLSRADLEEVLIELVENDSAQVVVIRELLNERKATRERLKSALKFEVPEPQLDIVRSVEKQYPGMKGALEEYEVPSWGMPTLEEIQGGLTPEIIESATKLKKPSLLIVPPAKCSDIVDAINGRLFGSETACITPNVFFNWFSENWQCKKCAEDKRWRVAIAEGVQNVEDDPKIHGANLNRLELWKQKYKDMNLAVVDEPVIYLTQLMKNRYDGQQSDTETHTIIRRQSDTKTHTMIRLMRGDLIAAVGCEKGGRVRFETVPIFADFDSLRMRGLVWVNCGRDRKNKSAEPKPKCRSNGLAG